MDKFEYVVALAAVITGLGLSDIAVSLHRLLKRRATVVWDWVPVALALYFGLALMRLWYQLWSIHDVPLVTGLPFVTAQVVQTLVLVLVASAALPDDDDFRRGRINLRDYYATHMRYVWTMYLAFGAMWIGTASYFRWLRGWQQDQWAWDVVYLGYFGVPLTLTACALVSGRRWHGLIVVALIVHEVVLGSDLLGLRAELLPFPARR